MKTFSDNLTVKIFLKQRKLVNPIRK